MSSFDYAFTDSKVFAFDIGLLQHEMIKLDAWLEKQDLFQTKQVSLTRDELLTTALARIFFDAGVFNVVIPNNGAMSRVYYPLVRYVTDCMESTGLTLSMFSRIRSQLPELKTEQCELKILGSSLFLLFR